jgi:hypothetical protein
MLIGSKPFSVVELLSTYRTLRDTVWNVLPRAGSW